jgi:hypothetical protein
VTATALKAKIRLVTTVVGSGTSASTHHVDERGGTTPLAKEATSGGDRFYADSVGGQAYVRFWHKADITRLSSNVRFWG